MISSRIEVGFGVDKNAKKNVWIEVKKSTRRGKDFGFKKRGEKCSQTRENKRFEILFFLNLFPCLFSLIAEPEKNENVMKYMQKNIDFVKKSLPKKC